MPRSSVVHTDCYDTARLTRKRHQQRYVDLFIYFSLSVYLHNIYYIFVFYIVCMSWSYQVWRIPPFPCYRRWYFWCWRHTWMAGSWIDDMAWSWWSGIWYSSCSRRSTSSTSLARWIRQYAPAVSNAKTPRSFPTFALLKRGMIVRNKSRRPGRLARERWRAHGRRSS